MLFCPLPHLSINRIFINDIIEMEHHMTRTVQMILIGFVLMTAFSSFAAQEDTKMPVSFDIEKYQIEGSSLINQSRLEKILAPYTGKEKDFKTILNAREALEKAYYDRGYVTVEVLLPEQVVEKGVVHLQVKETVIGDIKIEGNRFFNETNILQSLPALQKNKAINTKALSQNIKIANESPARKMDVQLQKVTDAGQGNILATVGVRDEKPWKVGVTLDNTGEDNTGKYRLGALLQHANLFNRDHILSLQYITSPTKIDKVGIYGVGYSFPVYPLAASVDFIGAYSDVSSGTLKLGAASMDVKGKGTTLGLHYNQTLPGLGLYEHKLILGLDYRAYTNDVEWHGTQLGNDVTVHPVSLTYAGNLTLNKLAAGFFLGVAYNLPGGWAGRDEKEDFEKVRTGARQDYTIFRLTGNLLYPFYGDWQARAVFNSQYANTPLVPGEQFGLGGADSVRGFYPQEVSSDNGYSGSVEIITPDLAKLAGFNKVQGRVLAFYDHGYVSRIDSLPGEIDHETLSSAGLGLRVTDGKYVTASVDYGWIIDRYEGGRASGGGMWHFMVGVFY